jgi:hypothetical protein
MECGGGGSDGGGGEGRGLRGGEGTTGDDGLAGGDGRGEGKKRPSRRVSTGRPAADALEVGEGGAVVLGQRAWPPNMLRTFQISSFLLPKAA